MMKSSLVCGRLLSPSFSGEARVLGGDSTLSQNSTTVSSAEFISRGFILENVLNFARNFGEHNGTEYRPTPLPASESGSRRAHFRKANIGRLETETQAENLSGFPLYGSVPDGTLYGNKGSLDCLHPQRGNSIKGRCDANSLPLLAGLFTY